VSALRAKLKHNLPILVALSVDTDDGVAVSANEVSIYLLWPIDTAMH
jgi:hypothetical protein